MAQRKSTSGEQVVLQNADGEKVTVTRPDDVVRYKFNGYRVVSAGRESVERRTPTTQKEPAKKE
jgi:hypothetical protein